MKDENKAKANRKLPGFYIAVCCCVLAIGAAGYFTQQSQVEDVSSTVVYEEASAVPSTPVPTVIPTTEPTAEEVQPTITEEAVPTVAETEIVEEYTLDNPDLETAVTVSADDVVSFLMPVNGEILAAYSDKPVYNKALDDWRTHNGIDIAANEGASVCAAERGTVDEVSYDVMGCYVTIVHDGGYLTKYMQLQDVNEVREGSVVQRGDVIGIIGKSTAESTEEPHLHFEIYKNNECLNPAEVM